MSQFKVIYSIQNNRETFHVFLSILGKIERESYCMYYLLFLDNGQVFLKERRNLIFEIYLLLNDTL